MSDIDVIVVSPILTAVKKGGTSIFCGTLRRKRITGLNRFPAAFLSGRKTIFLILQFIKPVV